MNNLTPLTRPEPRLAAGLTTLIPATRTRLTTRLPGNSLVAAVDRTVRAVPAQELHAPEGIDARMLLAVLVYSYATGLLSSREVRARVLALPESLAWYRDTFPFCHEIVCFRRRHRLVLEQCLAQALGCGASNEVRSTCTTTTPSNWLATARSRIQLAADLDAEGDDSI